MTPHPAAGSAPPVVEPAGHRLARLSDQTDLPLPEVFRRVCEAAADALRVERAGVWLFVNDARGMRCVSLFERSKRRHSKGACVPLADESAYLQAVAATPLLATDNARSDPRTAELGDHYLAPNGITSLLDAPLMRDDRLIGVVCHEHVGPPREWTDADRATARTVAALVVEKMKAAEGALHAPPRPPAPTPAPLAEPVHDLRNVLSEIAAHAELIRLTPGLPPGVADRLAKITAATGHGAALLRTLLPPPPPAGSDTGEYESLPADGKG